MVTVEQERKPELSPWVIFIIVIAIVVGVVKGTVALQYDIDLVEVCVLVSPSPQASRIY